MVFQAAAADGIQTLHWISADGSPGWPPSPGWTMDSGSQAGNTKWLRRPAKGPSPPRQTAKSGSWEAEEVGRTARLASEQLRCGCHSHFPGAAYLAGSV